MLMIIGSTIRRRMITPSTQRSPVSYKKWGERASALTYVDANLNNTQLADGTPWTPGTNYTTNNALGSNDSLWHLRTDATTGNGGTLFTSNESTPFNENAGVLNTTIDAPGAGTYDVFAMFWSPAQPLNEWRLQATLDFDGDGQYTDEQMVALDRTTAQHALASDFASSVLVEQAGNQYLYRGYLGTITVQDGQAINVYVDDLANTDPVPISTVVTGPSTNWRTWFDGVVLARVVLAIPEPASSVILITGVLMMGFRRRTDFSSGSW